MEQHKVSENGNDGSIYTVAVMMRQIAIPQSKPDLWNKI